jgi:hypothetical protein
MKGITALACLLLGGCRHAASLYEPAILRVALPEGMAGATRCAENNVPVVWVDSAGQGSVDDLSVQVHERRHTRQAFEFRGGCWPFLYRYREDAEFRVRMELDAYCEQGKWLIAHNRNPRDVWAWIAMTMLTRYGTVVRQNCLYEERK